MYGALIPEQMISQVIKDSKEYKIYHTYATGVATPKKTRKFKKITSPSKKQNLILEEEPAKKSKRDKHPEPTKKPAPSKKDVSSKKPSRKQSTGVQIKAIFVVYVSKKKALAKAKRSKGIELLSDASLLKEAQLKRPLKEANEIQTFINKGTGLKPKVPDVSTTESSKSENESWGDSGDEFDEQSDDDQEKADDERTEHDDKEEEIQDDAYIHTPEDYVPTDNETKEFDEEEYEELYGDANISFMEN
nr:hypothetical protein [Tanacetum cinerariifolium]